MRLQLGAAQLGSVELGAGACVDDAGDVEHGIGAVDEAGQAVAVGQAALHPVDAGERGLRRPRQRAHRDAVFGRDAQQVAADEAGAAGYGEGCHGRGDMSLRASGGQA